MKQSKVIRGMPVVVAGLLIALNTVQAQPTFYEKNGLVVIECESVTAGQGWEYRDASYRLDELRTLSGFCGRGFLHFQGNTYTGGDPAGVMTYRINITNPGSYRFLLRTMTAAPVGAARYDEANDCYVRMVGQSGYLGEMKKYVNFLASAYEWAQVSKLDQSSHVFVDPVYELSVGVHELQIAGRSKGFAIDRIIMINRAISNADSLNVFLPLSPISPDGALVSAPPATDILSPRDNDRLYDGQQITLIGKGTNIQWHYEGYSDVPWRHVGSGDTVNFTIPFGTRSIRIATFKMISDQGIVWRFIPLSSPTAIVGTQRVSVPQKRQTSSNPALYGVDGRKVGVSSTKNMMQKRVENMTFPSR